MLPSSPWTLLGLDPATATPRDLQRAYARLLKIHRPDEDPEAFQRLHQAYQTAKARLENAPRSPSAPDRPTAPLTIRLSPVAEPRLPEQPVPVSTPPLHQEQPIPSYRAAPLPADILPPAFLEALSQFDQALASNTPTTTEAATDALFESNLRYPETTQFLDTALAQRFERSPGAIADALHAAYLVRLLEHGCSRLAESVIERLHETNQVAELRKIASEVSEKRARLANPAAAQCLMQLGIHLATTHIYTAEWLANTAYPHLSPTQQKRLEPRFNHQARFGHAFRTLSDEDRQRWRSIIQDPAFAESTDWQTKPNKAFLRRTAKTLEASPELLQPFLPESALQILASAQSKTSSSLTEGSGAGCLWFLALFAIIKVLSAIFSDR